MKSRIEIWMMATVMSMLILFGVAIGILTYHYRHKCPKKEFAVTITYYPEGCHLESCSKRHVFPFKMDTDFYDYNFTLDKPAKIIRVNYYKKSQNQKEK